jgi:hypothetical protein
MDPLTRREIKLKCKIAVFTFLVVIGVEALPVRSTRRFGDLLGRTIRS